MKRHLLLSLAMLLIAAPQVHAAIQQHDDVSMHGDYATGNGGPFDLHLHPDAPNPGVGGSSATDFFITFCLEINETMSLGSKYDVASITEKTVNSNKHLSGYAAWVFDTFLQLTNPLGAGLNNAQRQIYQDAIWAGMTASLGATPGSAGSELVVPNLNTATYTSVGAGGNLRDISLNAFYAQKVAWTGNALATDQDALETLNGYVVLNLKDSGGTNRQDMLFAQAGTFTAVPEPASIVVWSLLAGGAAGIGVARKRRRTPQGRRSNDNRQAILAVIERGIGESN